MRGEGCVVRVMVRMMKSGLLIGRVVVEVVIEIVVESGEGGEGVKADFNEGIVFRL